MFINNKYLEYKFIQNDIVSTFLLVSFTFIFPNFLSFNILEVHSINESQQKK
jgi:hypothetical protein